MYTVYAFGLSALAFDIFLLVVIGSQLEDMFRGRSYFWKWDKFAFVLYFLGIVANASMVSLYFLTVFWYV